MAFILSFIIKEEVFYKTILLNSDNKYNIKNYNTDGQDTYIEDKNLEKLKGDELNNAKIKNLLVYNNNSCRYDSFLFIQLYILNYFIDLYNLEISSNIRLLYDLERI